MPHGTVNNPLAFVSIAPDGTVTIVCHRSEMGQGVRTGMPLIVADEMEADWSRVKVAQATGRRGQIRQPGHRRLPFDPAFLHADAPGRRRRPHDAGGGRRETLGRRRLRRGGEEPRGHSEVDREEARLWRTRRRRQHDGRAIECQPREDGAATPVSLPLKDPSAVPLHRQGRDQYRRRLQHHDRPRHLWSGRPLARAEIRRHRAPGGHGRQGRLLRRHGREEGPGRRPDRRDPRAVLPDEIPAVRRNRGHRRQHLGGDPGPQGAEDHLGRRPARDLRFAGLSRGDGGDRQAAWQGPAQRRRLRRRLCERGQESRGRVLHPSQRACDDGAAVRDLPDRRRQGRSLDQRAKPAGRA